MKDAKRQPWQKSLTRYYFILPPARHCLSSPTAPPFPKQPICYIYLALCHAGVPREPPPAPPQRAAAIDRASAAAPPTPTAHPPRPMRERAGTATGRAPRRRIELGQKRAGTTAGGRVGPRSGGGKRAPAVAGSPGVGRWWWQQRR